MKKNITINLFGNLYAIDEDAYALLSRYLESIKKHFSRQEGGEEIAEDIERRATELIEELRTNGVEAIAIEHVKQIIERIGTPEEMDESTDEAEPEDDRTDWLTRIKKRVQGKKLFRNTDDQLLGGVASGLGCYLGVDATWMRLLWVAVSGLSAGTSVLIYLLLWLIVPPAVTPEDRLRMQGKSVNLSSLGDEILSTETQTGGSSAATRRPSTPRNILGSLFGILVILIKIVLGFCLAALLGLCGITLLGVLIGAMGLMLISVGAVRDILQPDQLFVVTTLVHDKIYWLALISGLVALSLTIYGCVHFFMRRMGRAQPLSRVATLTCIAALALSATLCISSTVSGSINLHQGLKKKQEQMREHTVSADIQRQQAWLKAEGWEVLRHEGCREDTYIASGKYYNGDHGIRYIHGINVSDRAGSMDYIVERTVRVTPGTYQLEAVGRTDGEGPALYAYERKGQEYATRIPAYGNEGGTLWQEAVMALEKDSTGGNARLKAIADAHKGKGYGWSRIVVKDIQVKDSMLHYGVRNRMEPFGWTGTWFSVADVRLQKIK